ncbi:DUF3291 domain-containing protein [Alteromonas sp. ASW11-36]|uniref:DUF3291 domain-containing protein n=1 Tax=Alteromonas arenosi TaxID=3055817 RepID=A0ABT7SYJ1_9ALTE|nr:DUF3291 domain-containing protein [Alteromonas sp. ASW11-36]MDM7861261.1 DUF3291 domain-containing protein [Alteromonas sp. ASW11-36]
MEHDVVSKFDLESPEMADFVNNLDPINAIAERSPGFIWRLQDESGDATCIEVEDAPDIIVNMSVWENLDVLKNFMFKTDHIDFLKRKKEWFVSMGEDSYVLWYVPEGHIPTLAEAMEKLEYLRRNGESPQAFSLKSRYTPQDLI